VRLLAPMLPGLKDTVICLDWPHTSRTMQEKQQQRFKNFGVFHPIANGQLRQMHMCKSDALLECLWELVDLFWYASSLKVSAHSWLSGRAYCHDAGPFHRHRGLLPSFSLTLSGARALPTHRCSTCRRALLVLYEPMRPAFLQPLHRDAGPSHRQRGWLPSFYPTLSVPGALPTHRGEYLAGELCLSYTSRCVPPPCSRCTVMLARPHVTEAGFLPSTAPCRWLARCPCTGGSTCRRLLPVLYEPMRPATLQPLHRDAGPS
jgi:hypothetical protein